MAPYVFAKPKGGEGASTHATSLAVKLAGSGRDTLLVDADPDNESSYFFTVKRNEQTKGEAGFSCVRLEGLQIRHEVQRMETKYDDIVIDVGAKDSASLRAAFTVANKFVVPFCPSVFDMWTYHKISGVIEEMLSTNPDVTCISFLNKVVPPRVNKNGETVYSKDTNEAMELLQSSKLMNYLHNPVSYRKSFQNAPANGRSVVEGQDKKAAAEIEKLHKAIMEFTPPTENSSESISE